MICVCVGDKPIRNSEGYSQDTRQAYQPLEDTLKATGQPDTRKPKGY